MAHSTPDNAVRLGVRHDLGICLKELQSAAWSYQQYPCDDKPYIGQEGLCHRGAAVSCLESVGSGYRLTNQALHLQQNCTCEQQAFARVWKIGKIELHRGLQRGCDTRLLVAIFGS
jgi:hypothetical protein